MTLEALRHLRELLGDAAGYAAAVGQTAVADDLYRAVAAAFVLADNERAVAAADSQPALFDLDGGWLGDDRLAGARR